MDVKFFVFLEILDEPINAVLHALRRIFMDVEPTSHIHITVRGPYTDQPPQSEIETFESRFRQRLLETKSVLLLHGVREFETAHDRKYHVALRLQCDALRTIWWKPDYPIEVYGFNPHVTLYSGRDASAAAAIARFLKAEDLQLISRQFRFTSHVTRQASLPFTSETGNEGDFSSLVEVGRLKSGILQRATKTVLPFLRRHLEDGLKL